MQGNGTVTTYTYGRESLRLERLRLVRVSDDALLQDLRYTYDPVGNIVQIRDGAQPEVYFANDVVVAEQLFEYSALYRLTTATGREHASLGQPTDADFAFGPQPHPDDPAALRRYEESYVWDAVGNILELRHAAAGGSFTRQHIYAGGGNRLLSSSAPGESVAPFSHSYPYDAHGNMTAMPHLAAIAWDHADRMQHCDLGGGGDVWFVYDAGGERVRKVQVNASGSTVRERIYLGAYEVYRERAANSTTPTAERQTLHVADDIGRLCLVETLTIDGGEIVDTPVSMQRYQHGNHLGSAALELDENAAVISYEEFHPFGTTSYAANDAGIEMSAKRYRYIGKERDEETGLYHLGARYYASWLARWTAADPIGLGDGVNRYAYARGNPVTLVDPVGTDAMSPAELAAAKQRLAQINARLAELDQLERDAAKLDEGIARQKQQTRSARRDLQRVERDRAIQGKESRGEPLFPAVGTGESAGRRETTDAFGKSPGSIETAVTAIIGRPAPVIRPDGDTESLGPPPLGAVDPLNEIIKQTPQAHAEVGAVFQAGILGGPQAVARPGATAKPKLERSGGGVGSAADGGGTELSAARAELVGVLRARETALRVEGLLKPGGRFIGKPGSGAQIRELPGGLSDAQTLFDQLAAGGEIVTGTKFPGTLVRLPNGGTVGLRPVSTSGPPTIDVRVPGIGIREIKFTP
ncbi:MAG: hypothetical protein IAG13_25325 [Deltaproteobacteria bacterium]|nr:hypothetical protein [Nannocystaceae bacterium]